MATDADTFDIMYKDTNESGAATFYRWMWPKIQLHMPRMAAAATFLIKIQIQI